MLPKTVILESHQNKKIRQDVMSSDTAAQESN